VTKKLLDKQIHEITESINRGDICYINADTGETVFMRNNEVLSDYGISWEDEWDDDEDKAYGSDGSWPEWQKEMYADVKTDMEKVESWQHVIRIEQLGSNITFGFMEHFVEEAIPEEKLKNRYWEALSRNHSFSQF